jgi:hypothetical protein
MGFRKKLPYRWPWKKRMWSEWLLRNPDWAQDWKEPERWLPGEKEWFEEPDTWQEKIRRASEQNRIRYQEWKMTNPEEWRRHQEISAKLEEQSKRRKAVKEAERTRLEEYVENWWSDYHARQLEVFKKENQASCGSEGHLLEHPDEVLITLTGGHQSSLVEHSTLAERSCGDDPSTTIGITGNQLEEDSILLEGGEITEHGSEGHLLEHTDEASITLTGGHQSSLVEDFAGPEGASRDDPSVSGQGGRLIVSWRKNWRSVEDRILMRHKEGHQAFKKRRRQMNRGIYVEPPNTSPISPGGGLPEKGTKDWLRIRGERWKEEAKRIVETFKWWKMCESEMLFEREATREQQDNVAGKQTGSQGCHQKS